ncbi:hypothetical protein BGZ63DRAFT_132708 [Mariannaea sp. PMI_226]|nr:hypothetical protein BGZ63DRAFT_132708 [Mariannaea sp. PMI_226]
MALPPPSRESFEIAIICALPLEYDAVSLLIDKFWDEDGDPYGRPAGDTNLYTTGRMGTFDVVLVLLQGMGKVKAATAGKDLQRSYPSIHLVLLVGVCGGVPNPEPNCELVLGDVVISKTIVQYDFGKRYPDSFHERDTLEQQQARPAPNVQRMIKALETNRARERVEQDAAKFLEYIQSKALQKRWRTSYKYPGTDQDRLFQATYRHKHHQTRCAECDMESICDLSRLEPCDTVGCNDRYIVERSRLDEKRSLEYNGRLMAAQAPSIFVGSIGSADTVLKSGQDRDNIAQGRGIFAFEMEGAGLWDVLPCIVVKGICDYADSHKNKTWQNFAAATAAAATKALLGMWSRTGKPEPLMPFGPLSPQSSFNIQSTQSTQVESSSANISGPRSPVRQPCRMIPFPRNEDIVTRDTFAKLESLIPSMNEYYSVALWGLGGSGKTQIALEYAYRRIRDPACSVFWVDADSQATFARDYKNIARKLGLKMEVDDQQMLQNVRDRIEHEPRWLFILDNADDLSLFGVPRARNSPKSMGLFEYIPKVGSGTVLWTSRDERIVGTLVSSQRGIRVVQMREEEAHNLLEATTRRKISDQEREDARALLQELQWLPLAVSQAGAYMRRTSTPVKDYLSDLLEGRDRWDLLKETEFDRHRRPSVSNSVLETWNISIDRIRRETPGAYKMLNIIAYFDNQKIPIELLESAAAFEDPNYKQGPPVTRKQATEAIVRLKEFSFISSHEETNASEKAFEMHTLVQEALRYRLHMKMLLKNKTTVEPKSGLWRTLKRFGRKGFWAQKELSDDDETEAFFSRSALHLVSHHFPMSRHSEPATLERCDKYLAQAGRVCYWAEVNGQKSLASGLLYKMSRYLNHSGRWREAVEVDTRMLRIRTEIFGRRHPETMSAVDYLATAYHEQGRYQEAEKLYVEALEFQGEVLPEEHPNKINMLSHLAQVYQMQQKTDQALGIMRQVLDLQQRTCGPKDPATIYSLSVLGEIYWEKGRYEKAEKTARMTLDLFREVLGERHPQTLRSMSALANIYWRQGKRDEAERISIKSFELRQEVLGERHPESLQSMYALAIIWKDLGRGEEAMALMQRCWKLRCITLGPQDLKTKNAESQLSMWRET